VAQSQVRSTVLASPCQTGTFGGNTSCVEIVTGGDEYVICDLGTGVREFGNRVMHEHNPTAKRCFNVFLSHLHWDHIMGFPFFRHGLNPRQPHSHP